jgi:hypothetical protein
MMLINDATRSAILQFVDRIVPGPNVQVWLTGSRAKGTHHDESDWDVIAFTRDASADPRDLFKSNQLGTILDDQTIELVMVDLREAGIRLR